MAPIWRANIHCTLFGLLALAFAESIVYCGSQPYYPSQYTCYDGFLCPVIVGERTLKCTNACYLPEQYACTEGKLAQHPTIQSAFEMQAVNTIPALQGKRINACGQAFYVGGQACTYCPSSGPVASSGVCKMATNTTIIDSGGGLDVVVPGGQLSYIGTNGAFGFTQAHSASVPQGADVAHFEAFDGGYFQYSLAPSTYWLACPRPAGAYQVFADKPGLLHVATCISFNILTRTVASGVYGAWQYV